MAVNKEMDLLSSAQLEQELGNRIAGIRLSGNITQQQLAEEAGVGLRTLRRLETGKGVSLDTFVRVVMALNLQQNLEQLLPNSEVRPMERIQSQKEERKRARPKKKKITSTTDWKWGDEK